MCGITGWVSFHHDARAQAPVIEAMTATVAPRCPGAGGVCLAVSLLALPAVRP
ncbi:hypothetical protein [Streptomyces sp. NPDC005890]|uniref:hypothetical protein n=1 Tax=Streptomyces sp. NPDC005890 TaxID=3154568 RepID=UPI0033F4F349